MQESHGNSSCGHVIFAICVLVRCSICFMFYVYIKVALVLLASKRFCSFRMTNICICQTQTHTNHILYKQGQLIFCKNRISLSLFFFPTAKCTDKLVLLHDSLFGCAAHEESICTVHAVLVNNNFNGCVHECAATQSVSFRFQSTISMQCAVHKCCTYWLMHEAERYNCFWFYSTFLSIPTVSLYIFYTWKSIWFQQREKTHVL